MNYIEKLIELVEERIAEKEDEVMKPTTRYTLNECKVNELKRQVYELKSMKVWLENENLGRPVR